MGIQIQILGVLLHFPGGVRSVPVDRLRGFGVDDEGQRYVNEGKEDGGMFRHIGVAYTLDLAPPPLVQPVSSLVGLRS